MSLKDSETLFVDRKTLELLIQSSYERGFNDAKLLIEDEQKKCRVIAPKIVDGFLHLGRVKKASLPGL